ncbi:hypothetical protein MPOCJGCO_2178 [Methylobacterium trifolii]|uniref:Uncharacterized protein n=1 Tax=Methylobacterium trifolii TaxID=1003092 RepID=A0ABQ4U194_9HYPH|nr:hypothetical protein MPOCJGCO_2178 [Methylobacterium trifolii]
MNWVWPKAPAQEPVRRSGAMSPRSMILRVAISSPRKKSRRRLFEQASVASDCTRGILPRFLPKFDSTPHTAAMV